MSNSRNNQTAAGDAMKNPAGLSAMQGEWVDIPLSALVPSERNVRKATLDAARVAELAALIASQGLINPPTVIEQFKGKKKTGFYEVIAGSRRLAALTLLVERGRYGADEPITCVLRAADDATAISIAENAGRENLHPADEFDAFKAMLDEGKSIEDIAACFGVATLAVKQRLTLANVAPEYIEMYRKDNIGMDVLKALALTTDHKAQRRVWKEVGSSRNAYVIRRALTQGEVEASDRIARFVGAKAYERAGGQIRRDLFDREQSGFFTDRAMLERLAREKLEAAAAEAVADGAAWADVIEQYDASASSEYVRTTQMRKEPTTEQKDAIAVLETEQARIEKAMDDSEGGEEYEALDNELDAVVQQLDVIEEALLVDDPNQIEKAGVVVTVDYNGKLQLVAHLLHKADAKALRALAPVQSGQASNEGERDVSDSLAKRLSVQRTLALQVEVSRKPNVALAALTAELVTRVFRVREWVDAKGWWSDGVGVALAFADMPRDLQGDEAACAAGEAMAEAGAKWKAELCEKAPSGDVLGWLLTEPTERVMDLLAFCTAVRVDATVFSATKTAVPADALANAVALDMHAWWTPTASNYFTALAKPKIIEAIEAITGAPAEAAVSKMKKGEMASHAEQLVALGGHTWLPARMEATSK